MGYPFPYAGKARPSAHPYPMLVVGGAATVDADGDPDALPRARRGDWHMITAGQRVQIMKRVNGKAVIQFGTEVVSSADGSIAGLLGASPGASTAATG